MRQKNFHFYHLIYHFISFLISLSLSLFFSNQLILSLYFYFITIYSKFTWSWWKWKWFLIYWVLITIITTISWSKSVSQSTTITISFFFNITNQNFKNSINSYQISDWGEMRLWMRWEMRDGDEMVNEKWEIVRQRSLDGKWGGEWDGRWEMRNGDEMRLGDGRWWIVTERKWSSYHLINHLIISSHLIIYHLISSHLIN